MLHFNFPRDSGTLTWSSSGRRDPQKVCYPPGRRTGRARSVSSVRGAHEPWRRTPDPRGGGGPGGSSWSPALRWPKGSSSGVLRYLNASRQNRKQSSEVLRKSSSGTKTPVRRVQCEPLLFISCSSWTFDLEPFFRTGWDPQRWSYLSQDQYDLGTSSAL